MAPPGETAGAAFDRKSLSQLAAWLWRYRRSLAAGFAALLVVDALQLVTPLIVRHIIDAIAGGTAGAATLRGGAALVLACALVMAVCRFVWRYYLIGASYTIERELRQELYDHLQTLPPQFYDTTTVGDIMAHASNDIAAVRMATGIASLAAFDAILLAVVSIAIMLAMHPGLTLITLLPLPLLSVAVLCFGRMMHRRFGLVQAAFSRLTERAQESFSGMRVVKAYGDGASEASSFAARAAECARQHVRLARVWSLFEPVITALAFLTMAILLGAGGRMVIRGEVSLGQFVAFSSYLGLLLWPMMAVGWVINLLQRGTASMQRLDRILTTVPAIRDGACAKPPVAALTVKHLSFTYPGTDRPVLKDVSFSLPEGGTLGIVGRTGAGKTTLVELLLRLYDPPPGTVFVNGVDARAFTLRSLRAPVGYVPQETFLFAMSIADNIAFGADGLPRERIEALARAVELHDEIMRLPAGYDTQVGERGVTLSGGQKQRVAIARALAVNLRLLVLDDALSSVDTETEAAILAHLRAAWREITAVVIAHRVSTICTADTILVLDAGRVIESGTHASLVARGGFYADLYRMQQLEDAAARAVEGEAS